MNKALLLQVADKILEHPETLDMNVYAYGDEDCGAVCCIAGHACALSGMPLSELLDCLDILDEARKVLDLPLNIAHQLFLVGEWPEPFSTQYHEAKNEAGRAAATASRIRHCVATGE